MICNNIGYYHDIWVHGYSNRCKHKLSARDVSKYVYCPNIIQVSKASYDLAYKCNTSAADDFLQFVN